MTKKHDALYGDLTADLNRPDAAAGAGRQAKETRFLKRTTSISERLSGEIEEKTLRWIDPADCRMWDRHNRDYALLTEDNCRDLIDGIRSQGRQEFPAIVRALEDEGAAFEVICGARRHFAVSWLRQNNYTQFKYLVEVRTLTDEEAFRLADIENRDREDISDYERAIDYADAIDRYYGGKQKAMADRLEVSQPWLSRYLQLARLPAQVVAAFPSVRDIRERNARELKPLLGNAKLLQEADTLAAIQARAREGLGAFVDGPGVVRRLVRAGTPAVPKSPDDSKVYKRKGDKGGMLVRNKGRKVVMEFEDSLDRQQLEANFAAYLDARFS